MSQEEKEITETSKKQLLSAFSRGKGLKKKHTKMINIFGFSFFFSNEQSQLVVFQCDRQRMLFNVR